MLEGPPSMLLLILEDDPSKSASKMAILEGKSFQVGFYMLRFLGRHGVPGTGSTHVAF